MLAIPTPQSVYRGNYQSLPAATLKPPVEGNRTIPVTISWLTAGLAPNYAVEFNARQQQTLAISQIAAIHVDNSKCASSMHIGFPDTQFEILIGPNAVGFYPVVTNSLEFFAWIDLNPGPQDQTILQVLNFLPPPILFGTQLGGTGVGTVREVDTAAPITGGPITDQGTIGLSTPLAINFGGTGGATANAGLDNLSGSSGTVSGSLTRTSGGLWSVTAAGSGTITGVTAGNGMAGGGTSGAVTLGINPPVSIANGGSGAITANLALDNLSGQSGAAAGLLQRSTGGSWATLAPLPLALGSGGTGASGGNAGLDSLSATSGSTAGSLQRNASGVWSVSVNPLQPIALPGGSSALRDFTIQGVTDGSAAGAGNVGEVLTATQALTAISTAVWASGASVTLTPGNWLVWGYSKVIGTTGNLTDLAVGLATTLNGAPAQWIENNTPAVSNMADAVLPLMFNVTANTTVYVNSLTQFTTGTAQVTSIITALRVR